MMAMQCCGIFLSYRNCHSPALLHQQESSCNKPLPNGMLSPSMYMPPHMRPICGDSDAAALVLTRHEISDRRDAHVIARHGRRATCAYSHFSRNLQQMRIFVEIPDAQASPVTSSQSPLARRPKQAQRAALHTTRNRPCPARTPSQALRACVVFRKTPDRSHLGRCRVSGAFRACLRRFFRKNPNPGAKATPAGSLPGKFPSSCELCLRAARRSTAESVTGS